MPLFFQSNSSALWQDCPSLPQALAHSAKSFIAPPQLLFNVLLASSSRSYTRPASLSLGHYFILALFVTALAVNPPF